MIAQADKVEQVVVDDKMIEKPIAGREEMFCQLSADGDKSDAQAYRDAGYSHNGAGQNAGRMIKKDYIKRRIAYIRAERAVKAGITQEKQAIKLQRAQEMALADNDTNTYIRAVVEQSKHYGLSIDKQQTETTDAQRVLDAKEGVLADKLAKQLLDEDMAGVTANRL